MSTDRCSCSLLQFDFIHLKARSNLSGDGLKSRNVNSADMKDWAAAAPYLEGMMLYL